MSAAKHETNCPPVDQDIERRIRNFRNLTIAALCNITVLVYLVGPLWVTIKAVPSTNSVSFPLRWGVIVLVYLSIIAQNAKALRSFIFLSAKFMSELDDEERSRNPDLGTCITNLEDWMLANFCVIVSLSTIGFVGKYWIDIITLTVRAFFYWACTVGGLCLLFWLLEQTIRFYRKVKGVNHEEAWSMLVVVSILRFYDRFEGFKAKGVLGHLLDLGRLPFEMLKFMLDVIGFHIGRGPLFDRLPDEWKAARKRCKTWNDVSSFFAVFAGSPEEETDKDDDAQDRNDTEETCYPVSVFEWEPNPVILPHLRGEHLQSLDSGSSAAEITLDRDLMDTTGVAGIVSPDMAGDSDDKGTTKYIQNPPHALRHNGPTTMSVNLSSFACPHCTYVVKKRFELNKHVSQTHNHRFRCVYAGCRKTFGVRANCNRHEATHTGREGFACPNMWCETPEQIFTRKDNLKRHMKRCVTSE